MIIKFIIYSSDGTTDITRTVHFGTPSKKEKEMFTRVLLGNLDIERVIFAKGSTTGALLDPIARQYLWQVNCDYKHGTGHGVGYFLNVHEGPHGISSRSNIPLALGMIVSNEPGYYLEGQFGIRIENLVLVCENQVSDSSLKFENLTCVPYERNLFDMDLLSRDTLNYINAYHEKVMR